MKRILQTIMLCLLLVGCGGNPEIARQLAEVERLIEVAPDSAMAIIDGIDANALSGKKQKAHYALLKSMALDKNYIDTTTFDVLQPAIDYYLDHGTPDEKLRTYYYQGVIFYNRGDRDNTLHSIAKGLELSKSCKDSIIIARSLEFKGLLFSELYDEDSSIESYLNAAGIYRKLGIQNREFECYLKVLNGAVLTVNEILGDSVLNCLQSLPVVSEDQQRSLVRHKLSFALKFEYTSDIHELIAKQEADLRSPIDVLNLSLAYNIIGNNAKAIELLDNIKNDSLPFDTIRHLAISVTALEGLGNYKGALATYKKFSHKMDSINLLKFKRQKQLIEERHQIESIAQKKQRVKIESSRVVLEVLPFCV